MAPTADVIRSRAHPLVKRLRLLAERAEKDRTAALIEGPKLLEEALLSGVRIVEVAVSPRAARTTRGGRLFHELRARGLSFRLVDEEILHRLSETDVSQGVLAIAERRRFSEADLFRGVPLVTVAVGIQNPGNVGGLLRTTEAAGGTGAILTQGCADPFAWKSLRGSMGSAFRLPHLAGLTIDETLRLLRRRRLRTIAAAAEAPVRYDALDLTRPVAFLFGSEGSGVPDAVSHEVDDQVSIPIAPTVESLNVGVAAGILLFEAARQRR